VLPSVSIGITVFNRAELVTRAIESVLAQTYAGPLEVVIVDDGSNDHTGSTVKQLLKRTVGQHPLRTARVHRHSVNCGIATAKNSALRQATGHLRGLLDSDDWYAPEFVARCVAELDAHPAVGVVYTDDWTHDAGGRIRLTPAADWNDGAALMQCRLRGDTWLARWSVLEASPLHDERMRLEIDYDLFHCLWRAGVGFRRIPTPLVHIFDHGGRTTNDRTRAAYWHAACLAKYGHPVDVAFARATGRPQWHAAIREGYAHGMTLR
jgi:glycosyltransferase involved in cell wall biosynthesis